MRQVLVTGSFALVVCICLALLGVRLRGKHCRGRRLVRLALVIGLLCGYAVGVFWLTLGGRVAGPAPSVKLDPLWSYRESLVLFGGSVGVSNAPLLVEIVLNVLLFVPLGALLVFAWPERFRGLRGAALTSAVGAGCSLVIESLQLILRLGLFELDDVLNNTLGAVGGYLMCSLLSSLALWLRSRESGS